jgi:hypothetical protein
VYHPDVLVSVLRPAFVAASVVWVLLLPLVPFIASRPHATPIGTALIIAVYAIGSAICHQLSERSYHLWTAQMPVCARCAGIYAGAALTALVAAAAPPSRRPRYNESPSDKGRRATGAFVGNHFSGANRLRVLFLVAALPTLATLVYEWTTGQMPTNWIRTAAGVPLGAIVAWMVLSSMPRRTRTENQVN